MKEDTRASTAIAIIGLGCLFPDAQAKDEYWNLIEKGRDAIGPIPLTHWSPSEYFDADPKRPDHTYAETGGFLKPYAFDPLAYGLAPHALEATDTTQLLGMVAAHQALVDAGYGPDQTFDRDRVACILGVTGTLELVIPLGARLGHPIWKKALADAGVPEQVAAEVMEDIASAYVPWQENSFPGLLGNVVAGRIANRLDLGGTNSVVDAACASSLAALHMAMMELQTGRADLVISGGMDTFNSIFMYMCFSKTPALSPSGQARPFDAAGDGTILGEGLGAFILKRLDDAQRDGDRIYGVIRGMGTASDGKGQAIYAPSPRGQIKTLERAYREAGVSPRSIGLVEAHGTGTKVGDGVELEALKTVYRQAEGSGAWCRLGSVKSQIGHTKAAAGAAGLIKAVLALHHKVLPPTIKVRAPHPQLVDSPFILENEARPWLSAGQPRRAAVSAFGFGGSDYHCVLEEFTSSKVETVWDPELYLALFSADDQMQLAAQLHAAQDDISKGLDLRQLCRAWRQDFKASRAWRVACWGRGREEFQSRLVHLLEGLQKGRSHFGPGTAFSTGENSAEPRLGLIFAGQGSQIPGMLRELACRFPEFLELLEKGEALLLEKEGRSLGDLIYPPQAFDDETRQAQQKRLTETTYAQLSLAVLGIAALKVLRRFQVEAEYFAGHSFGELLALHAAGVLSEDDTLRAAYERGLAMARYSQPGGTLLAVMAPLATVEEWLQSSGLRLSIANINGPEQVIIGGPSEEIAKAQQALRVLKMGSKRLEVSGAFHTDMMGEAVRPFLAALESLAIHPAERAVFANSTAALYPSEAEGVRSTLTQQLVQPVRFMDMLQTMRESGANTFIEVGPQRKLASTIKASLASNSESDAMGAHVLSLDSEAGASQLGLAKLLLELSVRGYAVRWDSWDPGPRPDRSQLGKPRFHVSLSGANYRAPAKPKKQGAAVSASVPVPKAVPMPLPLSSPSSSSSIPPSSSPSSVPAAPLAPPMSAAKVHHHQSIHEVDMSQPNFGDKQRVDQLLNDLQDIQRRTTEAHTLFLENQRQFQSMLRGIITQDWAEPETSSTSQGAPQQPTRVNRPEAPQPARLERPAPPAQAERSAAARKIQQPEVRPQASSPSPLPTSVPAVVQKQREALKNPAPSAAPAAAGVRTRASGLVFSILARLTGYPESMLQATMQLESDLGIDSIKKVEIYAQLQQEFPELASDPQTMNEVQTIGDLVSLCDASEREAPAPSPVSGSRQPETETAAPSLGAFSEDEGPRSGAWAAGKVALAVEPVILAKAKMRELLAIIADKTGFPAEMLRPDMDLESDLGIDSIKKVEIFSSVQEHFSELRALSSEQLNAVRTIADFESLLQENARELELEDSSAEEPLALGSAPPALSASADNAAERRSSSSSPSSLSSARENAALVYKIVSEKTGYPESVLSGDMDLEADLGIDSIKKVEIYAALAEHTTSLPQEAGASVRTLGELVAQLGSDGQSHDELLAEALLDPSLAGSWDLSAKKKDPTPEPAPLREAEPEPQPLELQASLEGSELLAEVGCLRLGTEPFQSRGPVRSFSSSHEVWIADDGSNLARNMMLKLQERGVQARLVSLAMHERWQVPDNLGGLYLLAPLKFDHQPIRWLQQSFKLLRKVGPALAKNSGISFLVTLTRHGGRFGLDGVQQLSSCFAAGVSALAKTIAHEWPGVHARALDLGKDFADGFEAALRVLDTSLLEGPLELGVLREQLFRLVLRPEELGAPAQSEILKAGDLVLVSGGARGVTAATLLPLAEQYQPHFVIWGRTALQEGEGEPDYLAGISDPATMKSRLLEHRPELSHPRELERAYRDVLQQREIRQNIAELEAKGARVSYLSVDVSRENEVRQAFQQLRAEWGSPVGIIHGAGVIHDKLLLEQKDEEIAAVLDTKLRILSSLEEWLGQGQGQGQESEGAEVRPWLVLFSSTTARLGRKGQGAYAVANEVLNKFAFYAQHLGGRALALNWGPWDGGMVQGGLKKLFAAEGIKPIPLAAGAALMHELLLHAPSSGEWLISARESLPLIAAEHERERLGTSAAISIDLVRTPILSDHVLKHRAVVPAALLLEWLCVAAQRELPSWSLAAVENFQVWKGIVLDGSSPYQLECVLLKREMLSSDLCWFEMTLREVAGRAHAHARIAFQAEAGVPVQLAAPELAIDPQCESLSVYEGLLFHGEKLHLIEKVLSCDSARLWARIRLQGKPKDWSLEGLTDDWVLHAPLLDAVFQAAIVWSHQQLGLRSLPSRLGKINLTGLIPQDEPLLLELELVQHETHLLKMRARILDESGRLYWIIEEFEAIMDASLSTPFAQNQLPPPGGADPIEQTQG